MKVVLELQDQPSNIKKVTVRHDIVIGRGAECNLRLSAPQVSRRHCFLRVGADAASITDLESSNGTFIDGERMISGKRYMLTDGMAIAVGPIKFVTRVQSEVLADSAEVLHVEASDQSLLADNDEAAVGHRSDAGQNSALQERGADLTAAGDPLHLTIEHAGPSAEDDEPTARYSSDSDRGGSMAESQFPDVLDSEAEIVDLGRRANAQEETSVGFNSEEAPETLANAGDEDNDDIVEAVDNEDISSANWFSADSDKPDTGGSDELQDFLKRLP